MKRSFLIWACAVWMIGVTWSSQVRGQDDGEGAPAGGQGGGRGAGRQGGGAGAARGAAPAGRASAVTGLGAYDQAQVARGGRLFRNQCASCHGFDARGGAGFTEIDLMRTPITYLDITGRQLEAFLKTHPKGRAPFAFSYQESFDVATWLRYEASDFVSGRGGPRHNVFSGDARAGEAFFNGPIGQCSTCHSVTADLKGIGARANGDAPTLTAAIVSGSGPAGGGRGGGRGAAAAQPAVTATVTLETGDRFVGVPITVNDWLVELRLADGTIMSWLPRNGWPKVATVNRLQAHIDLTLKYTDDDLRNLAAYLRDK